MPIDVLRPLRSLLRRGFVGPRYAGVVGRIRFVWQEVAVRKDVMLVCTADRTLPAMVDDRFRLVVVSTRADVVPFLDALSGEIGEGRLSSWLSPLSWGERLFLLLVEGRVVAYRWAQYGERHGFPYYAGRLFDGECRVNRGGVFVSERRKGYNTILHQMMLTHLFDQGAARVFVDVAADNIVNLRSVGQSGYVEYARLTVLGSALGGFIRWERPAVGGTDGAAS